LMTIANRERVSIGGSQGTSQVLREIVDSLRQFVPEISSGGTSRAETSQMNGRSATIPIMDVVMLRRTEMPPERNAGSS